jgi:hypothetical protein
MAIVATDWTVSRLTGDIRYTGGGHGASPTYITGIELHRWLQDLADDPAYDPVTGDEVDITTENPSRRITDNYIILLGQYNIDQVASEHIYNASIEQAGGDDIWDAIKNFGNASVQIEILQDGALATNFWNQAGAGLNPDPGQGVSHQFILKVRTTATDIDGRRLLGMNRTYLNTYGEFPINGSSRGINVLALSDAPDLNNITAGGTVATWTTIANLTEGYANIDADVNGADEFYYSEWNKDIYTINQFYERMKYLTRVSETTLFYGIEGQIFRGITHEIEIDTPTGTFAAVESVSWPNGTGQMLAIDSTTAGTKMWIQLLTGIAPVNDELITGTGTALVNLTVTLRTSLITTPFVGASTGSSIVGGYGVGIEAGDLTNADKLFDLDNNPITPPNNVVFSVSGVVVAEDRVLVAPWDGISTDNEGDPAIELDQQTLATTLSGAGETAVVVSVAIPTDTPSAGDIRIQLDTGVYREVPYLSYTGSTYTIASTSFTGVNVATTPRNVWIAYIDKLATSTTETFTSVFLANRDLVVLVRDGGGTPIKQFISGAELTGTGGSSTAIRTSDL